MENGGGVSEGEGSDRARAYIANGCKVAPDLRMTVVVHKVASLVATERVGVLGRRVTPQRRETMLLGLHLVAVMMLVMRERCELLRKAGQALVDRVHACTTTDGCNDGKGEEVLHVMARGLVFLL